MTEIWKPIKGFEGLYEVSNYGNVKSLERFVKCKNSDVLHHYMERILKPNSSKTKLHLTVVLCKDGITYPMLVHRLVAEAFIPNPENKPVIDHIDTDYTNNHVENLRWCTQKENCNNELTRQHNSESKKGHPCYLLHHSEEVKAKIRSVHLGAKRSEEAKKKMSEAHKGKRLGVPNLHLKGKHWKVEGGKEYGINKLSV